MEIETSGVMSGAVLLLYPILFTIHHKIGKYDVIVGEFKQLRSEHKRHKGNYHAS